jgi:hypothetical protein
MTKNCNNLNGPYYHSLIKKLGALAPVIQQKDFVARKFEKLRIAFNFSAFACFVFLRLTRQQLCVQCAGVIYSLLFSSK